MRDFRDSVRLPGRLMLAAGFIAFGLIALCFNHVTDGLIPFEAGQPWPAIQGGLSLLAGLALAWPASAPRTGLALWLVLTVVLFLHGPGLAAEPTSPVRWVSAFEVLGLICAAMLIAAPGRRDSGLAARISIGLMLVVFGAVHWSYVGAITGMIPDWMPGRDLWPWVTGAANIAAGLAILSGVLARLAAGLVGVMFASWILLVHTPRLLAAPGDRSEWVALALAFALTGVVWTLRNASPHSGAELQSRDR